MELWHSDRVVNTPHIPSMNLSWEWGVQGRELGSTSSNYSSRLDAHPLRPQKHSP